jgi:DNA replication protein DnaD
LKKNLVYYQHYTNSHQNPKFILLRSKYGWAGEGKFWALNNIAADSDHCMLDISKDYKVATYAEVLGFTVQEFLEYVDYLVNECELFHKMGDIHISNEILQENIREIMKKREASRKRKATVNNSSYELFESSPEQNNKEREKENKESNNIVDYVENFSDLLSPIETQEIIKILSNKMKVNYD